MIQYTLVTEGSSDGVLIPLVDWVLQANRVPQFSGKHYWKAGKTLGEVLNHAIETYPCDLLLVHRDADEPDDARRRAEIDSARRHLTVPVVVLPVVPIQETEAWLLVDERALRIAAGNPNGNQDLQLEERSRLESISRPKEVLHRILRDASGLNAHRRKKFDVSRCVRSIPSHMREFAVLRELPSFERFFQELSAALQGLSGAR